MKAGRPSEIIRSFRSGKITTLNCEGCHRCCGAGVALSDKEARTHPLKFYASKYANDRPRLCDRGDGYCGLLTKEGLCGAYDKRPKPCREYDCRVVALRNLVLKRMGEDIKHEGAVRPDWEFELETDEDRAVLDTFEQLFRDKPELKDQYPIDVVRRYWPDSTYNAILYGANDANRLSEIATKVSGLADSITTAVRKTAEEMVEAGRLLLEAKELVKHGEFKQWITDRLPGVPYRTAASWMAVAKGKRRETLVARLQETPLQLLSEKQEQRFLGGGSKVQPAFLPPPERSEVETTASEPLQLVAPTAVALLPLGLPKPKIIDVPTVVPDSLLMLIRAKLEEGVTLDQVEEAVRSLRPMQNAVGL